MDFQPADGEGTCSWEVGLRWGPCYVSPGELKQKYPSTGSAPVRRSMMSRWACVRGNGERGRRVSNWKHTDVTNTRGQTSDPWVSVSAPDLGSRGPKQRWQLSGGCPPGGGGRLGRERESSRGKRMQEGWGVQRRWGRRGAPARLGRTPAGGFTSACHSPPLSATAPGGHYHRPSPRRSSEPRGRACFARPHSQGRPSAPLWSGKTQLLAPPRMVPQPRSLRSLSSGPLPRAGL